MRKVLWITLAVVLLALGGGAWWFFHSLDSLVASAIRTYGPEITGVRVSLSSAKIQAVDGAAALRGLELGNPKGFKTERALSVAQISMRLDVASLTKDVVLIKEVSIEQPEVTYEYASGGSNLDVIQRQVEAYIAAKTGAKNVTKKSEPQREKKFIIEHLYIKGARANVSASLLQGKAVTLPIPDQHLIDIGKKAGGVSSAEATRQIVSAITKSVGNAVVPLNLGGAVESAKKGAATVADKVKGLFK
jgi:hypothetical protein